MANNININGNVIANNNITSQGDIVFGNKTTNIYQSILENYSNNKDKIDKTLIELKKEISKDLCEQVDKLLESLNEKKEKEALGAWQKLKETITKIGEVVNTGEKAFNLCQKLADWLEKGWNLMT